jgi:dTDP-4-dehydrorhamnose reductase
LDLEHGFKLDKTSTDESSNVFAKVRPEVVVDSAALTNVDYCEIHREEAWRVNVEGSENIARLCSKFGSKLVHISTDYVFDGEKGNYLEQDTPAPLNYYGVTKREAEERALKTCSETLIVRPSIIYSWTPQREVEMGGGKPLNFAMWIIKKLANNEPVKIVGDQFNSPTLADNLAEGILHAVERDLSGILHLAGGSRLSRYEFVLRLAQTLGLDTQLVQEVRTADMHWLARRPRDSSLNIEKAKRLELPVIKVDEALQRLKTHADVKSLKSFA